jgi:hypothetical protein
MQKPTDKVSRDTILETSMAVLMDKVKWTIVWMLTLPLLASCSAVPQPEPYVYSQQRKMQTAHHWDILANNIADQVNRALIEYGYLETPVYVRHTCGEVNPCGAGTTTNFDEGFQDLLTTQLVHFGVPTLAKPDDEGLNVEYKVQVIYHRDGRIRLLWPGELTMLTMGIVALQSAPWEIQALVGAATADLMSQAQVIKGNYEVIISVSVVDDKRYLMRNSSIFYISDPNFWHYQYSGPAKEIELTDTGNYDSMQPPTTVQQHGSTDPYHYLPVSPLGVQ